jgi:meiotic recombination protein REC8
MNGSQRSSLFPWDNAGASSSNGNAADGGLPGSENFVDHVDVRLRSNSLSHHSPIVPSIATVGIGFSPVPLGRGSQVFGEDFAFDGDFNHLQAT